MSALETLRSFELDSIPDLDVAVEGALETLSTVLVPDTEVPFSRPLVIGSGNAEHTGRIIYRDKDAYFANESNFELALDQHTDLDGVVIVSAAGAKHSVSIAKRVKEHEFPAVLFTNNPDAPAGAFMEPGSIRVFPKNREPYTYNVSTYFGMVMAKTKEDPAAILKYLKSYQRSEPDLAKFTSFTFVLPAQVALIAPMLRTKFDELFGTKLFARFFTPEEIKHAKTIVPNEQELFISMTPEGNNWGEGGSRWPIELPTGGYLEALAVAYHLIGHIQRQHPPYFKENLPRYCEDISHVFGHEIKPIVE
jgi:hypothetical protein